MNMNPELDKLEQQIADTTDIQEKVNLLLELSWQTRLKDEPKSFAYCDEAQHLIKQELATDQKALSDCHVVLSCHYQQQSRYSDALKLLGDAETYYTEHIDKHGLLRCYYVFSTIYEQLGNHKLHLEYVLKRLQIAEELALQNVIATIQSQLGNFYREQEEIDKSLDSYSKSLDYYVEQGHQVNAAIVLLNMASSYRIAQRFDEALAHIEQALSVLENLDNHYAFAIALGIQGLIYEDIEQYDNSLASHQEKLKLVEQLDSDYMRGYTYADVGRVMVKMGQIDEGISWILSAIEISDKHNVKFSLSLAYAAIVTAYETKGDYQSAFHYQKKLSAVKESQYKAKLEAERTSLIVMHETRQAQQEAERQRERANNFRSLAENSPDWILRITSDGIIHYVNAAAADTLGFATDDSIEQTISDLTIPPKIRTLIKNIVEDAFITRHVKQMALSYQSDGYDHHYDVLAVPEFEDDHDIAQILLIGRDITPLKQVAHRLRTSEQRYRSLFEQSIDGVLILSLIDENDVVRVIDANQRFCDMLGYTIEEIRGMKTVDLVIPEDRQGSIEISRQVLQGEDVPIHNRQAMTKDGRQLTVETTGQLIWDESGTPLYSQSIVRDITERMQAEKALADSELRYRTLFEQSNDAIFILNYGDWAEIIDVNQKACDLLGYSADELRGKRVIDLLVQEERPLSRKVRAQLIQGADIPMYERRVMRKDGSIVTEEINITTIYDDAGKPLYVLSIARDITDRKQMEEVLRQSEARFRAFIEKSSDLIITFDLKGIVTYVSPQVEKITTFGRQDLLGKNIIQIARNDGIDGVKEIINQITTQDTGSSIDFEMPITRINDETMWLRGTITNLRDDPDVGALVANVHNITELKESIDREQQKNTFVKMLLELTSLYHQDRPLEEILSHVLEQLTSLFHCDYISIMLMEDNHAQIIDFQTLLNQESPISSQLIDVLNISAYRQMYYSKKAIELYSKNSLPLIETFQEDLTYYLGMPLFVSDEVLGFLNFYNQDTLSVDNETKLHLETLASHIAVVLYNYQSYKASQELAIHDERQRIARELHDAVSQYIFSARIISESLPELLDTDPAFVRSGLDVLVDLTKTALVELRMLLIELRPSKFLQTPIETLVENLIESFTAKFDKIDCKREFNCNQVTLSQDAKLNIYRIIQEALNNIAKHANPRHVGLTFTCNQSDLHIIVEDDGEGFDVNAVRVENMGLNIMRERAQQCNLEFSIHSQIDKGTRIELRTRTTN